MIYFTSDTHFSHSNILKYQPNRKFNSVSHMDDYMVSIWNETVGSDDIVYHLGDFGWNTRESARIAGRLNGRKILVPGNHDRELLKNSDFVSQWETIAPYSYLEVTIESKLVVMSHYPIWEWNQIGRGSYHLHGHIHGKHTGVPGRILDVGADTNNLKLYSWNDVKASMERKPIRYHI